jgi:hypothetical protein
MNNAPSGQYFLDMSGSFNVPSASLPITSQFPNGVIPDGPYAVAASVGLINSKVSQSAVNAITVIAISYFQVSGGIIVPGFENTILTLVKGPWIVQPNPATFPVSPGDQIYVGFASEIIFTGPNDTGPEELVTIVIIQNQTTKKYLPDYYITPPFNGDIVVWVVSSNEVLTLDQENFPVYLPNFLTLTFIRVETA